MTELEKKMLLTKDEYEYLMEYFAKLQPSCKLSSTKQINYYFDTDELEMNQQNITCRVRFKDGQYKGTMKRHFFDTDKSTEEEIELYDGVNNNAFTDMGLKLFGNTVTERCIVMENSSCKVILDKNEYLDIVDYELEIEYGLENEANAEIIFRYINDELMRRRWRLVFKDDCTRHQGIKNKSRRFFERYANKPKKREAVKKEPVNFGAKCEAIKDHGCSDPDEYLKHYTLY